MLGRCCWSFVVTLLAPTLQVPIATIKNNVSSSREEIANNNSNENINNNNDAILNNNAIFAQLTQEENALGANDIHKKKHKP